MATCTTSAPASSSRSPAAPQTRHRRTRSPGAARAPAAGELGLIRAAWSDLEGPAARALACEYTFCNVNKLPSDADLAGRPTRFVLYEVVDAQVALDLHRRGAEFIETFAWPELTAALAQLGADG